MARHYKHISELSAKLEASRKKRRLSYGKLGDIADVDYSQAYRICTGKFKTLSANVLRICNVLAVVPPEVGLPATRASQDPLLAMLQSEMIRAWDKTPDGAEKLAKLIQAVRNYSSD